MRKDQYLSDSDVIEFVVWFSSEITEPKLTHCYEKSNGSIVKFNSLIDALKQYEWPFRFTGPGNKEFKGKGYKESEQALSYLANNLRLALDAGNDNEACEWACRIMKWGGVTNGNASWLRDHVNGLATEILTVKSALNAGEEGVQALQSVRRFNSGMTKVYSLLVPGFIIYDSRVAAALAWFVNEWCEKTDRKIVPTLLAFPCMPAKEGENPRIRKSRNPSNGTREFPQLNNQARVHAQWNIRASWLLDACLNHSNSIQFNNLRELEAALFMWGYNLNSHEKTEVDRTSDVELDELAVSEVIARQPDWLQDKTLSKKKPFQWIFDVERDALIIDRGLKDRDIFTTTHIFILLHQLYDEFGHEWFPLANNVQTLEDGSEQPGLGKALYSIKPNTTYAQASSQLAPILMRYEIFDWKRSSRSNQFRLQITPPSSIADMRMLLAQVAH